MNDWEPILGTTIPGNPRPAPRYQRTKTGREYMPKWYQRHKDDIAWHLRAARGPWRPAGGREFAVKLRFFRESRVACDVDNLTKTVLDAMHGVVLENDHQVEKLIVEKLVDREHPRTEIRVWVRQLQEAML